MSGRKCEVADAEVYEEAEVEDMSEGNTVDEKMPSMSQRTDELEVHVTRVNEMPEGKDKEIQTRLVRKMLLEELGKRLGENKTLEALITDLEARMQTLKERAAQQLQTAKDVTPKINGD